MEVRPIDANALKKRAMEMEVFMPYGGDGNTMAVHVSSIDAAPTLDYAPVRRGEWIEQEHRTGDVYFTCSACKEDWFCPDGTPAENNMHFCPCCGARMEEDGKDV